MLARHLDGTITAVDLLPAMIEGLRARMKRMGLGDRVTALVGSMDELAFGDEELDLIWAEGSIYNIGFERGLTEWRRFLKPGGVIAVTECSWLAPSRLPETAYIRENFPDIDTPAAKVRILEKAGYVPLAHFVLPAALLDAELFRRGGCAHPRFPGRAGPQPGSGPNGHADAGGDRTLPRPRNGLRIRFLYRAETRKVILSS